MSKRKAKSLRASTELRKAAYVSGAESAHMGASYTQKEIADWLPWRGSPDSDLLPDLPMLSGRSRDLVRNHGIAAGALQTQADNVVGTGYRLSATPDYRALGRDKEWAEEWSNGVEALWRSHANTRNCDAAHCLMFDGLTRQIFNGGFLNGEAIVLPLWLPGTGGQFATKFQVIEADRLSNPNGRLDTDMLRGGVEQDRLGRPLAYWIQKSHPGDAYLLGLSPVSQEWQRIPAETPWGRPRVIHVHDKERSGQSRGKPTLSSVLMQFKMFDQYTRTELQAAIVNAMIAAFIETPLDGEHLTAMFGGDVTSPEFKDYLKLKRENVAKLKGAAVIPVFPGDKLAPFTPSRPAVSFDPFTLSVQEAAIQDLNMPYELLLKDFSRTNYSSARAALLEAWRFFLGRRKWLCDYWCTPAYEMWLEEAISLGLVDAPGFYDNRYAYARCKWIGPGRGWVDPVREADAAETRMKINISTLEDECAEQGRDWEEVIEQRASELKRIQDLEKEMGISFSWNDRPVRQTVEVQGASA
ncbi:MAG: phage portal protein [Acidobacteria bacterium]|nr:phage portal protein [Acidobacteriota bacterium]